MKEKKSDQENGAQAENGTTTSMKQGKDAASSSVARGTKRKRAPVAEGEQNLRQSTRQGKPAKARAAPNTSVKLQKKTLKGCATGREGVRDVPNVSDIACIIS